MNGGTHDPGYSHLLVDATHEPLARLLRIERGRDLFSEKVEASEWPPGAIPPGVLLIEGSHDIRLVGMTGLAHPPGSALITLDDIAGVQIARVAGFQPATTFSNLKDQRGATSSLVSGATPLLLFEHG